MCFWLEMVREALGGWKPNDSESKCLRVAMSMEVTETSAWESGHVQLVENSLKHSEERSKFMPGSLLAATGGRDEVRAFQPAAKQRGNLRDQEEGQERIIWFANG